ncbi:MAG TPA: P22 phage major capsid protein family protein, partial [Methanosarcina sp.]|nr:P22 phage major capsid protein family protein [Methanosarcina sp.]
MSNAFSKEERVAFEQMLEGFNDALVLSKNVNVYRTNAQAMERQSDTIWRPMPYIMTSFDGMDASAQFKDVTQLSVPASLGYKKGSAL